MEEHAAGTKSQICTTCSTLHTSYGPLILSNNSWMYSPGLVCKCTQNFCQPGAFLHLHPESMQKLFLHHIFLELGRTKETLENQETSMKGIQEMNNGARGASLLSKKRTDTCKNPHSKFEKQAQVGTQFVN